MNNIECNVARDMMPLVIDQVASEESRTLVEVHVADCEPCAQVYLDMQAKTPEKGNTAEDNSFAAAMRQLRRTVGWRRMKVIVLCAIIIPATLALGYLAYVKLFLDISRPMPLDWYSVNLSRTSDGIVLASIDTQGLSNYSYSEEMRPNHSGIIYLSFDCPIFPTQSSSSLENPRYISYVALRWKDGKCLYPDVEDKSVTHPVKEIRKGTETEYEVLYKEGDEIPLCPPTLEDYVHLQNIDTNPDISFVWFPVSLVLEWS